MSLGYNIAYHLHSSITLDCGRNIQLGTIKQFSTYEGLLEGVPSKRSNDNYVEYMRDCAQKDLAKGYQLYLILPERRDYLRTPGDMETQQKYSGTKAEWLPLITCIGRFTSLNNGTTKSELNIMWYQDDFGMGLSEHTLQSIKSMNWDRYATAHEI
jgi:hypothetical protein